MDDRIKLLEKRINLLSKIVLTLYRAGVTSILSKSNAAELDRLVAQLVDSYGDDPRKRS